MVTETREVSRACFNCKYSSEVDIYLHPDDAGVGRVFGGSGAFTTLELTEDDCEICDNKRSLRKV